MYNKITRRKKYGKLRKTKNRTKRRKTNMRATRKQKRRISIRTRSMRGGYNLKNFILAVNNTIANPDTSIAFINEYIPTNFASENGDEYDEQFAYVNGAIKYVIYNVNDPLKTQILDKIQECLPNNKDTIREIIHEFKTEKKGRQSSNRTTRKASNRESTALKRQQEEEAKRQQEEEAALKRQQEEEAALKRQQEEEVKRQQEEEVKRQQEEEVKRQQEEENDRIQRERGIQKEIERVAILRQLTDNNVLFWKPFFNDDANELMQFKNNMVWLLDNNKICSIIEDDIPTYATMPSNIYEGYEMSHYNSKLCLIFIILGILSEKLKDNDIRIVFKGGKAVQLALSNIPNTPKYMSDDVDIILLPKQGTVYNRDNFKKLASDIGHLIHWVVPTLSVQISPYHNPDIVKISLEKEDINFGRYKALADIDFKELPPQIKPYFENTIKFPITAARWGLDLLFECPTINAILDEKIYYLIIYDQILDVSILQNNTIQINDSNFHLTKIYKALNALIAGIVISNPKLSGHELLKNKINELLRITGAKCSENKITTMIYRVISSKS
jgi:hypothetical protein